MGVKKPLFLFIKKLHKFLLYLLSSTPPSHGSTDKIEAQQDFRLVGGKNCVHLPSKDFL